MVAFVSRERVSIVHAYLDVEGRDVAAAPLLAAGREVVWLEDEASLSAALPSLRVLACGGLADIDWAPARSLELVQIFGAGVDHLPAGRLPPRVQIVNARGIHGGEIRDHALAMMLAFARELPRLAELQRRRRWAPFAAGTLREKTLGILGLGHIGRDVAAAGRALGMLVIGTRTRDEPVPEADETLAPEHTQRVLAESDYVVVCLPATAATRGLIDENALAAMKPSAVLVVLSRGGIVDEAALCRRLHAGALGGAALDVFADEPLSEDSPLWSTPRLLVSPHMAGLSHDYFARAFAVLAENLERLDAGVPLLTPVDLERGY